MDRPEQPGPMSSQHAGLRSRIARLLKPPPVREVHASAVSDDLTAPIRERIERLEVLVESLQDELYRHSKLQDERDKILHRKTQPEEIARALDADRRRRGL